MSRDEWMGHHVSGLVHRSCTGYLHVRPISGTIASVCCRLGETGGFGVLQVTERTAAGLDNSCRYTGMAGRRRGRLGYSDIPQWKDSMAGPDINGQLAGLPDGR